MTLTQSYQFCQKKEHACSDPSGMQELRLPIERKLQAFQAAQLRGIKGKQIAFPMKIIEY
jgi:hypothetical protein